MTIVSISVLVEQHGHSAVQWSRGWSYTLLQVFIWLGKPDYRITIEIYSVLSVFGIYIVFYVMCYVGKNNHQILLIFTQQTDETLSSFPIIKYFSSDIFFWLIPAYNRAVGGVVFFPGLSRFLFMVKKHLPSSKLGSPICYFHSPISPLHTGTYHPTLHPLLDVIIEHYLI